MTVEIRIGDVRDRLREMTDDSVDCVVTSPPYWGLRDYGVAGQLGLEPTLGEHIATMVEVFEEVRRVLKPHGTLWLNYGDCYATTPNGRSAADTKANGADDRTFRDKPFSTVGGTIKPKDLCMIPNRLAIALQDAGWFVRSEIIWGKPNPMPDSSGAHRPATAHEKIWLMSKSGDADIWRARDTGELSFAPDLSEQCPLVTNPAKPARRWMRLGSYYDAEAVRMPGASSDRGNVNGWERWDATTKAEQSANGRNLRNYEPDVSALVPADLIAWEISTSGFSGAHFATFPTSLVVPCILGGCPVGGTVLDPFGGSGTVGIVAERLQRNAILIELNPDYADMAATRLKAALVHFGSSGFAGAAKEDAGPLFDMLEAAE